MEWPGCFGARVGTCDKEGLPKLHNPKADMARGIGVMKLQNRISLMSLHVSSLFSLGVEWYPRACHPIHIPPASKQFLMASVKALHNQAVKRGLGPRVEHGPLPRQPTSERSGEGE